jgi:hypothetical protein
LTETTDGAATKISRQRLAGLKAARTKLIGVRNGTRGDYRADLEAKIKRLTAEIESAVVNDADSIIIDLRPNQAKARQVAEKAYPYRCCVVCGLQLAPALELAHLNHHPAENDPDNLAWFCGTHHRMYDSGLYRIEAIKLLRSYWQLTKGIPNHKPRMKDAGQKAARKRDYRRRGRKAAETRKTNAAVRAAELPA